MAHFQKSIFNFGPLFLLYLYGPVLWAQTSLTTYHNDQARDGWNQNETLLTPSNVNSTQFGKLFSNAVDGQVYAQPLYMPSVSIGGGTHNVVYVVTENDSAYAFDADSAGVTYWHDSFIGGVTMTVAQADVGNCSQITPEIGITDTPVIDPSTGTLYFVAMTKTVSAGVTTYSQTLHALDITSGLEKFNGPQTIGGSVPGTGDGGSTVTFRPRAYKERCALALVSGVVYTSWTGHCDSDTIAGNYYGWVIGYNASNITQQVSVFNSAPNGSESSFWESGDGPSVDSSGNLYFLSANGTFDQTGPVSDYGQCFLKLNTVGNAVTALDYFAPMSQASMSSGDQDVGSAGQCLLPASWGTSAHPNIMIGADKPSDLYVVDADTGKMGEFSATANNIIQTVPAIGGKGYTTPALYSNGTTDWVYWGMSGAALKAFTFANGQYLTTPSSQSAASYGASGSFSTGCVPSVSSNGTTNGIVWTLDPGTPVVLYAYDATNLATVLYNSGQNSTRDSAVAANVKFAPPSVVNGKVYVPTANSLVVYGLIAGASPTPTGSPAATSTQTLSPSVTRTRTGTPTLTGTFTLTGTPSRTTSFTPTVTLSPTPSLTQTATVPFTITLTWTVTSSPTRTATGTNTPTVSYTQTPIPTWTATKNSTPTLTSTASAVPTLSPSPTPSMSPTHTATGTSTSVPTSTATSTQTATRTPVWTQTGTSTFSATASPTNTMTPTYTTTLSPTATSTKTSLPSDTPTSTSSLTIVPTQTNSPVPPTTSTPTVTNSPTETAILPSTPTPSPTPTYSSTLTSTVTPTQTLLPTLTWTNSKTPDFTASATPSATTTATPIPSLTPSPTLPSSSTPTSTTVPTLTSSPSPSSTDTTLPTLTTVPTLTWTFSKTPVFTASATPSATTTATPVPSLTPSPTLTSSPSPSSTETALPTLTDTVSPTWTMVQSTVTPSRTSTMIPAATSTSTQTLTPVSTLVFTSTVTITPTPVFTPVATSTPRPPTHTFTPTLVPTAVPTPVLTVTITATFVPTVSGALPQPVIYPNPVVGSTVNLRVFLASAGSVRIQVFTLSFRKVGDETVPSVPAGSSVLTVPMTASDGKPLSNGLYYLVVTANGKRWVLKLLILR